MGIVNGTFDTDLSGWQSNEKVYWENGYAKFRQCGTVRGFMSQRFVIDNPILSFDWGTPNNLCCAPGCVSYPAFILEFIIHSYDEYGNPINTTVISEMLPASSGGTIIKDVSHYLGKDATLQFRDTQGGYCCGGYTGWYFLIIDNVILSQNWGTLRVSSVPGGANIYVDDSFINLTPETGSIDLTHIAPGSHTIKITKADYYDSTATVNVSPGRIYKIAAALIKQVGCLSFLSDPVGAKIFLSGRNGETLNDTGFTTFKQICDLFWGDYKWKLLLDGYYPQEGTVTLNTSAGAVITKTLTQIGIGCIYFTSSPAGAKIFVDNVDTGKVTPDTICGLSLGSHHYELVLTGYLPASGDITLVSTHGGSVSLDLCTPWQCEPGQTGYEIDGCGNRRANPACLAKGSIRFTSIPPGAEIFLNGADQDLKTPATLTDVQVGLHGYTLKLDGFKDSTGTVQVLENQTVEVSVSLIPLESCIYFVTSIPGAKIYVDDMDTGKVTPALICGLSLGSHTYRLELSGYAAVTGTTGIGAGQGVVVASVLTPVEKGIGAGTLIGLTVIGIGAVYFATRKRG